MILPRVIALVMISASAAAQAQQQPAAAPAQSPVPTATKVQKVCRIHMDQNIPRRVCMTKEQWAQVDAENGSTSGMGYNRQRCNSSMTVGAC
jgi:Spy/CpxP family protein refolding chaperone